MELSIDEIAKTFFSAFVSSDLEAVDLVGRLSSLFLREALIIHAGGTTPAIYLASDFLASRQVILTTGRLQKFREFEIDHRTEVFGNIAHRFSLYQKSGTLEGNSFEQIGIKTIQLVRIDGNWKISSVAWNDESESLRMPERLRSVHEADGQLAR